MRVCLPAILFCFYAYFMALGVVLGIETAGPTETVKSAADQAILILRDPLIPEETKSELISSLIRNYFDFIDISKRVLGTYRHQYESRLEEFVPLFTELVEKMYLSQIKQAVREGINIEYRGERKEKDFTEVYTYISDINKESYSIEYRLRLVKGRWRIYDIQVEGISLVNNYRSQFQHLLSRYSFDEVLEKLKAKVVEIRKHLKK